METFREFLWLCRHSKAIISPFLERGYKVVKTFIHVRYNLKICIYMPDLDFQKHCQLWINVLLVIKYSNIQVKIYFKKISVS